MPHNVTAPPRVSVFAKKEAYILLKDPIYLWIDLLCPYKRFFTAVYTAQFFLLTKKKPFLWKIFWNAPMYLLLIIISDPNKGKYIIIYVITISFVSQPGVAKLHHKSLWTQNIIALLTFITEIFFLFGCWVIRHYFSFLFL